MLVSIQRRALRGSVKDGMSPLGTVTDTRMFVLANAFMMVVLTSKILTLSMFVCVLRKCATWEGGGRLSPSVP